MKRIQRKRSKGWKMPSRTFYVGRPGEFGNPFKLVDGTIFYYYVNRKILSPWIIYDHSKSNYTQKDLIYFYEMWITGKLTDDIGLPPVPDISILKGLDLACWCKLSDSCHADVLLKLLK